MRICGQQPCRNADDGNCRQPMPPVSELFRKKPQILLIIEKVCGKPAQRDLALSPRGSHCLCRIVRGGRFLFRRSLLTMENTTGKYRTTEGECHEHMSQTYVVSFHATISFVRKRPQPCDPGRCMRTIVV